MSTLVISPLSSSRNSFWVFDANGHACSQGCDAGFSMDSDGFWRCMHGQWRVVDEVPSVVRPHHPYTCPGNCSQHPLINSMISAFFHAQDAGLFWGDILVAEEQEAAAAETPAQRAARLDREAAEERKRQAAIKASELSKVETVVAAMPKVNPRAKWNHKVHQHGLKPCRYFCYQGVLGRPNPAEKDPKSGMWWPAGCAPHLKGRCEFFHPDEPEWAMIVAGKANEVNKTGGRDFSALKNSGNRR